MCERLLKTIAFICACFLLIYVLIATSSQKPTGLSLFIYTTMNQGFYWGARIALLTTVGFLIVSIVAHIHQVQEDKKKAISEEKQSAIIRKQAEERRLQEIEVKKEEAEKREMDKRRQDITDQMLRDQREEYLKNRSAEDANAAALKNFL